MLQLVPGSCLATITAKPPMATTKIGTLKPEDRLAVFKSAKNLGLDPYEFGALIHKESGFRPNVWGGAGGQYRGLIQFGPGARKEVGLPSKDMSIAEQMPYVEKYFQSRGFKPGMDITQAYATVLGGNPKANIYSKDAFGTNVAGAVPGMKKGGSLYKSAQTTLGDPLQLDTQTPVATAPQTPTAQAPNQTIVLLGGKDSNTDDDNLNYQFLQTFLGTPERGSSASRSARQSLLENMLSSISGTTSSPNYFGQTTM